MTDTNVMVVDDHPVFASGLTQIIDAIPGFKVTSKVCDGAKAMKRLTEGDIDLVVTDIAMPHFDGLELIRESKKISENIIFVVLTFYTEEIYLTKAIEFGASGYLGKNVALESIEECLDAVRAGKRYVAIDKDNSWKNRLPDITSEKIMETLTPTEKEVFKLLREFFTSNEIGDKLNMSNRTVDNHRSHICKKLSLKGPGSLLKFIGNINRL